MSTRFDTKIAVLLREDLEPWQRLNATAFLVSGLGTELPELIGEAYADADAVPYLPMFRQPVLVFQGPKEVLRSAHTRTLTRSLPERSSPRTSSPPATTRPTGQRYAPCPRRTWTWWASRSTARRTRWTRSSRARGCTRDRRGTRPAPPAARPPATGDEGRHPIQ
ncbi:hypothetical protein SHKM778_90540 [Streptomyces sp. KM77-8]|uniref:DUF2000 family protein n=1 Tax=Streptomyces haneummycinicus TaxID=3074435 RepID=A0AAT9HZ37_9ACTN